MGLVPGQRKRGKVKLQKVDKFAAGRTQRKIGRKGLPAPQMGHKGIGRRPPRHVPLPAFHHVKEENFELTEEQVSVVDWVRDLAGNPWFEDLQFGDAQRGGEERKLPSRSRALAVLETTAGTLTRCIRQRRGAPGADTRLMQDLASHGTLTDRMASLALLVKDAPISNVAALEELVKLCESASRRVVDVALEQAVQLFRSVLLPPERRLCFFRTNPIILELVRPAESSRGAAGTEGPTLVLGVSQGAARRLVVARFEHDLKLLYARALQVLTLRLSDSQLHARQKALEQVADLLAERPEQEKALLVALVESLNSTETPICERGGRLLRQLQEEHPPMVRVIWTHVAEFLYRPQLRYGAAVKALQLLSEAKFQRSDADLAREAAELFVGILQKAMDQSAPPPKRRVGRATQIATKGIRVSEWMLEAQGEKANAVMKATLAGIRRAAPVMRVTERHAMFLEGDVDETEPPSKSCVSHAVNSIYRLSHCAGAPSLRVAALALLHGILRSMRAVNPRLYNAVYEELRWGTLFGASNRGLLWNVLAGLAEEDAVTSRAAAIVKRLLQVAAHEASPAATVEGLSVAEAVMRKNGALGALVHLDCGNCEDTPESYDPKNRDPQYSNADRSRMWELHLLSCSVHPTIAGLSMWILSRDDPASAELRGKRRLRPCGKWDAYLRAAVREGTPASKVKSRRGASDTKMDPQDGIADVLAAPRPPELSGIWIPKGSSEVTDMRRSAEGRAASRLFAPRAALSFVAGGQVRVEHLETLDVIQQIGELKSNRKARRALLNLHGGNTTETDIMVEYNSPGYWESKKRRQIPVFPHEYYVWRFHQHPLELYANAQRELKRTKKEPDGREDKGPHADEDEADDFFEGEIQRVFGGGDESDE